MVNLWKNFDAIDDTKEPKNISDIAGIYPFALSQNKIEASNAVRYICDLLNKDSHKISWVTLAQSCRYLYVGNRSLSPPDLENITGFPGEEAAHLLGIASMNSNGYVREAAVCRLVRLETPHIIPYLFLRLNDWVPIIQQQALAGALAKIETFHPIDFVKYYTLVKWLDQTNRVDLKGFHQTLLGYIKQDKFREEIIKYLEQASVKENLFYWGILGPEIKRSENALKLCLENIHPEVRLFVIRFIPVDEKYRSRIEKLCKDRSLRVKYAAFKSIPKGRWPEYQKLFEEALFDRAKKVRHYGRFVLSSLGIEDVREIYQNNLKSSLRLDPIGTLLGWQEVALEEDVIIIKPLLTHPNSQVRLGAYQALLRLNGMTSLESYVNGLKDSNTRVRNFCAEGLKSKAYLVESEMYAYLEEGTKKARRHALNVLIRLNPPESLKAILYALSLPDSDLKFYAWDCLGKWYSRYHSRLYFSIDEELYTKIEELCQSIEATNQIPNNIQGLWYGSDAKGGLPEILRKVKK